jgi:hypothetical protein
LQRLSTRKVYVVNRRLDAQLVAAIDSSRILSATW